MDEKRITDIQHKVTALLADNRLKKAIEALGADIEELQDWELRTRYNELQTAYRYMLEYLRMGMPDPDRERLHGELIGKCYVINDQIAVARLSEHSTKVYCQMRRRYNGMSGIDGIYARLKENHANMEVAQSLPAEECRTLKSTLAREHEQLLPQLFGALWSSNCWSKGDAEKVQSIICGSEISLPDRAVAVSAITLSALKCFEPHKATTLCNIAACQESLIATRATIGLIIILFMYGNRIKHYPAIVNALAAIRENTTIMRRIQTIQIQLLRCRETQKIDRKMREEIIPAMMKNPKLSDTKLSMDILKEIENDEDKNPEWRKWIEEDEIKGKIEEMSRWQIEGADVYMSTFSQLKNFPFFSEMSNWLRPFDATVPCIADILPPQTGGNRSIISAICASQFFCNSDKYSFCLTFERVPKEQRDALMEQITGGGDPEAQAADTMTEIPAEKKAEIESNQYIQDLYRFFKVSNFRHEFTDPFTLSLNLLQNESLAPLIDSNEAMLRTFRYLVEKEYYSEAFKAGQQFEKSGHGDAQFFQEMGYCAQKECDFDTAIDYYTKADIVKPDTLWTLRHIAQCYRLQGESEKALSYYLMAEELAPENISLLMQTGESHAALKQYDEAFARFYKVEYLKPDSRRAMRAIAWCSFITGKDSQARSYYKRLMELPRPTFEDYLNAGHVEWATHNNALAVEYYTLAAKACGSTDKVAEQIMHDSEVLIARGVSEIELQLLRDLIV